MERECCINKIPGITEIAQKKRKQIYFCNTIKDSIKTWRSFSFYLKVINGLKNKKNSLKNLKNNQIYIAKPTNGA